MKNIILLIFLIVFTLIQDAFSREWYCDQVASEWMERGKMLQTCGIGRGETEDVAREKAYEAAKKEYDDICSPQTNCGRKTFNVEPMRSICNPWGDMVVCHRLFHFYVGKEDRKEVPIAPVIHNTYNKEEIHNHYKNDYYNTYRQTVHVHKNIIKQATVVAPQKYSQFMYSRDGVSVYQTNDRTKMGVHLYNPSERQLEAAIRSNRSGGMNRIYIHRGE